MGTDSHDLSRREFMAAGAAVLLSTRAPGLRRPAITARQAVERIRAGVGVPWRDTTVDTFKAGDPDTAVTGIATAVMATLPVAAPGRRRQAEPDRHLRAGLLQRQRRSRPARERSGLPREEGVHRGARPRAVAFLGPLGRARAQRVRSRAGRHARLGEAADARQPVDLCDPVHDAGRADRRRREPVSASAAACG